MGACYYWLVLCAGEAGLVLQQCAGKNPEKEIHLSSKVVRVKLELLALDFWHSHYLCHD